MKPANIARNSNSIRLYSLYKPATPKLNCSEIQTPVVGRIRKDRACANGGTLPIARRATDGRGMRDAILARSRCRATPQALPA